MTRRPLGPAALLAAVAFAGAELRAQVAGGTTAAAEPPRAAIDASSLRPERRSYRLTILRAGLPSPAGERIVTVRETVHGGGAAWAISETRQVAAGASTDSAVATRDALSPLHWEASAGGARLAAGIARDTLYGALAVGGARRPLVAHTGPGAVLNGGMLEALVSRLPLAPGAAWTASLVLVDHAGVRVAPATIAVTGEERVSVPAGTFDAWRVTVRVERGERTLWVSRDGRGVVRSEERLPDVDGAVLEQALASVSTP